MTPEELSERLLDHAQSPYHLGSLPTASHRGVAANPDCGDLVEVELRISADGLLIQEAWFKSQGCLICRGGASLLMEHLEGKGRAELEALSVADVLQLIGVSLAPLRQRCVLLALLALRNLHPVQAS